VALIDVTEPPTNDHADLAYSPQPPLIKLADPPPQYAWYFGKPVGDKFIAIDGTRFIEKIAQQVVVASNPPFRNLFES